VIYVSVMWLHIKTKKHIDNLGERFPKYKHICEKCDYKPPTNDGKSWYAHLESMLHQLSEDERKTRSKKKSQVERNVKQIKLTVPVVGSIHD